MPGWIGPWEILILLVVVLLVLLAVEVKLLEVARRELTRAGEYQFQVVNDTVDDAVKQISEILRTRGIVR